MVQRCAFLIALLLATAGTWRWPEAWAVALAQEAFWFPVGLYLLRHDPGLIAERARALMGAPPGVAAFDRVLVPLFIATTAAGYAAAGLQRRLAPPPAPLAPATALTAAAALAAALAGVSWALLSNRWFSGVVRLQPERGHAVCSAGPYAFVRHPAYAAWLLQAPAECVLLQSSWAGALGAARCATLVVRAALEDRWLHQNLPGYREYAARVRYRLVPWLW
jgi:protein-S-isoprenylcysteine O-methyltransferase Ste14